MIFVKTVIKLRDLRNGHDLSQNDVTKLLKCSQQTYSRYDAYVTEILLQFLIHFAEYYNTIVDYLIGLTNKYEFYSR